MDNTDYSNMSNAELKLCLEKLQNEFEKKKADIVKLCKDLEEIQFKYNNANSELDLRKNIF